MLGAFNEETPDWLSFFMFTYFTDRDGKMQLESLAQSGFDPLSRTCRFMLTEEAHHMFVGETGCRAHHPEAPARRMNEAGIEDPYGDRGKIRALGVIDLPTIQKKLNLHYTLSLDLFGAGNLDQCRQRLQCRHQGALSGDQARRRPSSLLDGETYQVWELRGRQGGSKRRTMPALKAINMRLRDDYTRDGVGRRAGAGTSHHREDTISTFQMKLPHEAFNRQDRGVRRQAQFNRRWAR